MAVTVSVSQVSQSFRKVSRLQSARSSGLSDARTTAYYGGSARMHEAREEHGAGGSIRAGRAARGRSSRHCVRIQPCVEGCHACVASCLGHVLGSGLGAACREGAWSWWTRRRRGTRCGSWSQQPWCSRRGLAACGRAARHGTRPRAARWPPPRAAERPCIIPTAAFFSNRRPQVLFSFSLG